jgi:hypothetical protein
MKGIMKNAVDKVYTMLWLRMHEPEQYRTLMECGSPYTSSWDEPKFDFKF